MTIKDSIKRMTWKDMIVGTLEIVFTAPGLLMLIVILGTIFG